jgi:hypothetical protein
LRSTGWSSRDWETDTSKPRLVRAGFPAVGDRGILGALLAVSIVLMLPAGRSRATAADDVVDCLDEQARTEARRAELLGRAESLGVRIEVARAGGTSAPQDLLRRADRLDREAQDLDLELVLRRTECRERATRALPECERRIAILENMVAGGSGGAAGVEELLRMRALRTRLQGWLAGPVFLGYPLIPPDSTDTPETLAEKLRYHEEVIGALRGLGDRVQARRSEVAEERRSLEEADRLLRDLRFLDEGGRVSPSGNASFRGPPSDNATPDSTRRVAGAGDLTGSGGDLERILAASPTTPEESDRILRLLDGYSQAIERELGVVTRATGDIRQRVGDGAHGQH